MSLTMIKLQPDMGRLIRWAEQHRLLEPRGEDDLGYALHALLAATFGAMAPKPFMLRREPQSPPAILGYSPEPGEELYRQAQAAAEPDAAAAIGLDTFSAKSMPDSWQVDRRFGFAIRVRPMLRTDRDGDRTKTKEVDAFLLSPANSNRGEVYTDWLRARLPGAAIERVALDAFRLSRVRRRNNERALRSQNGPEASFSGILRVTDGAALSAALARGIGRHRAFGFGMLLLRPAR
jgi:CRISPR system Cascade subunit CasE